MNRRLRFAVYLLSHVVVFLVGVLLIQADSTVLVAVGASMAAAGAAGWVLLAWVLVNERFAGRLETAAELGLVDAFTARSARIKDRYDDRLNRARQSIDIAGFGLRALREDYGTEFENWAQRATVRILLIDPEVPAGAPYAAARDLEEKNQAGAIASDVGAFLAQTAELRKNRPDRFQVRLYTALPSINVFRVDDDLFWGPYLMATQSRNTPTLLIRRGGWMFDVVLAHFESIWTSDDLSHAP